MNTASPSAQYFVRFGSPAADSGYGCFWREADIAFPLADVTFGVLADMPRSPGGVRDPHF
jgi:hypothetical protein